jgi:uncharacterized protein YciI
VFVFLITFVAPRDEVMALMGGHDAWLREHHGSGTFLVSGPSGAEGGVILVGGDDREAAEALAASDPLVRGGVARCEVVQFRASQSAPDVKPFAGR